MAPDTATRHLGLDLGGTNIKWVVVSWEAARPDWLVLTRGVNQHLGDAGS